MVGIIEYGSGNVEAILKIYRDLKIKCDLVDSPIDIPNYSHYILPGVGDFDETISKLRNSGMINVLEKEIFDNNKPILGICVGMQILAEKSEEGELPGLGWIPGYVKKFDRKLIKQKPYLPHMGWNTIMLKKSSSLFKNIDNDLGFYFVHSFYFDCKSSDNVLSSTVYGEEFTSAVYNKNIYGTQFHPEKSHSNGVKLFSNFSALKNA